MRRFAEADLQAETLSATLDGHTTRIAALPRVGANLVSFQVDGREFIHFDPDLLLADSSRMTGCFHMFPTPCALDRGRYTFQGRQVIQQKRGEVISNHGLLRDEVFAVARSDRELIASLEWDERHPVYEGFPWPARVEICYRLIARGLEICFTFENRGHSAAPVGYGIHPFWQFTGDRADVFVKVPAQYRLALDNYADQNPTGELIPVEGTRYDLRDFRSLADLFIDDVFWPRPEGECAEVVFRAEGLRVRMEASANMRHLVCYSPEGRPFVCIENLTSAPDAQNLHAKRFHDISGLTVVEPGGRMEGWVRYRVEAT
jgi:aldose 1-epimerase